MLTHETLEEFPPAAGALHHDRTVPELRQVLQELHTLSDDHNDNN